MSRLCTFLKKSKKINVLVVPRVVKTQFNPKCLHLMLEKGDRLLKKHLVMCFWHSHSTGRAVCCWWQYNVPEDTVSLVGVPDSERICHTFQALGGTFCTVFTDTFCFTLWGCTPTVWMHSYACRLKHVPWQSGSNHSTKCLLRSALLMFTQKLSHKCL